MTTAMTLARPWTEPVRRGGRDILPIAASVVPFGTVVGATLVRADLVGLPGLTATALLYAGSAQLATLSVLIAGGGPLGAILAGAVVNSRLLLYSAGLGRRFSDQPAWFRWLAPLTTVDQTFALAIAATDLDRAEFRRYWLTLGVVLGAVWMAAVQLGLTLGSMVPEHSPIEVAAPATIVSLLIPHLGDRRLRRVSLVAVTIAAVGHVLPSGLGIIAAVVVALAIAGPSPEAARS